MTKNFKKVISTVAALAMAASSFVAMAATYPDVAADNKYYSAIEQVSALGIIEGFDDGTFKPDDKVTRAQMAKLVVGAKNLLAEAEGNTRQVFDDVAPGKSEWAMGYVATANDYKIVNGTSDTTFDPDATVTYMQAMKMLVVAAGYEDWAQDQGGWPEGYRYYGNQLKIGAGVTGVSDDTELTRGQVAQMLVNALKAPILDITGYERDNGEKYPKYEQMDGKSGREYQTLLTDAWDVYEVYGRVTATSKDGTSSLKPGEVNYQVEKSDNYDDAVVKSYIDTVKVANEETGELEDVDVLKGAVAVPTADAAESGAEDLLLEYSYALIHLNDDDEATIVYIESAGKNKTVEFDGELIKVAYEQAEDENGDPMVDDDGNAVMEVVSPTATLLEVYKNENTNSTTKYKLSSAAQMIVNGVVLEDVATVNAILAYATTADVTLVDSPQAGIASIDGEYDYIVIDYYATGVVTEVVAEDEDEVEIALAYSTVDDADEIIVDYTADEKSYVFVDTNGNEVDPATIAVDSVLSVAFDVNEGFDTSSFYNVVVSTDKVEGRVSSTYTDTQGTNWFVINGTDYEWAAVTTDPMEAGNSYTLYLDKDGKIAYREILASSVNYAIIDRYYESAGDDKVRLILKDGTKVDYIIADAASETVIAAAVVKGAAEKLEDEADVTVRFVTYTVNKNNEVRVEAIDSEEIRYNATAEYKEKTSKVGSFGVADTSVVLDASAYAENTTKAVGVSSKANLIDAMQYGVVALGQKDSASSTYPMIVIIDGAGGYTVSTRMAVVASAISMVEVDNVPKEQVEVVEGNETVTLIADDFKALNDGNDLKEGDAIIYKTDADGEVDGLELIYSVYANKAALQNNAAPIAGELRADFKADADAETEGVQRALSFKGEDGDTVEFYIYPVYKKYASSIDVVTGNFAAFDDADVEGLDFDADAVGYKYDGELKKNWVDVMSATSVKASSIREGAKIRVDGELTDEINLTHVDNNIAYAVVRKVDGDIQEVYSIYFD